MRSHKGYALVTVESDNTRGSVTTVYVSMRNGTVLALAYEQLKSGRRPDDRIDSRC